MTRPTRLIVVVELTPGDIDATDPAQLLAWLPTLGPTATWLTHILASHGNRTWNVADLAEMVGLCNSTARTWAALDRVARFHCGWFPSTDTLVVHRHLPVPPARRRPERLEAV